MRVIEVIDGKIVNLDEQGIYVFAPYDNVAHVIDREYKEVRIGLKDARMLSNEQRKKIYAILGEISEWQGDHTQAIKELMKLEFITKRMETLAQEMFSLSNCSMTLAREFISFLIDFVVDYGVPTRVPLIQLCEDIERAVYACLMNKRCVLCGNKAQLHHFDAIGMGRNRTTIYQINMRVVPLCDTDHKEAHTRGQQWLTKDMHVVPIPLTAEIGRVYGLTKKNLQGATG